MRPRNIRIIDLGLTSDFANTSTFVYTLLGTLGTQYGSSPLVVAELVRTDQTERLIEALAGPADVVHIVSHGWRDQDGSGSRSAATLGSDLNDVSWTVAELATALHKRGQPIGANCVYIDACESFSREFRRAIRDCIGDTTTYVGCRGSNGWFDATTYASSFYPALLRNKASGTAFADRALEAGESAAHAFSHLVQRRCPFDVIQLVPTRQARGAFTNA
jgi:hypothetical protein